MSVEPPHNGHAFGAPVPGSPAPARFAAHPATALPAPRYRHEPPGFGPAGFSRGPVLGYAGPSDYFGEAAGFAPRPNTLAILALVFAFCSPLAGLVLGLIAKKQIAESGEPGDGMALAGIIVGAVFTVVTAIWMVLVIITWVQLGPATSSAAASAIGGGQNPSLRS